MAAVEKTVSNTRCARGTMQRTLMNIGGLQASLYNCRGHKLYVRVYQPSSTLKVKGFILFHHGYGAHTTLYDHGATEFSLTQTCESACLLCFNQTFVLPKLSSKGQKANVLLCTQKCTGVGAYSEVLMLRHNH